MSEITCFLVRLVNRRSVAGCSTCVSFDMKRVDTGELVVTDVNWFYEQGPKAAPPGAMWWRSTEGGTQHLMLMTPGGAWDIDGRASNCNLPDDTIHNCWPRRGRPPGVTVDKSYGLSCSAGAGSIQVASFHGLLRDGVLSDA